ILIDLGKTFSDLEKVDELKKGLSGDLHMYVALQKPTAPHEFLEAVNAAFEIKTHNSQVKQESAGHGDRSADKYERHDKGFNDERNPFRQFSLEQGNYVNSNDNWNRREQGNGRNRDRNQQNRNQQGRYQQDRNQQRNFQNLQSNYRNQGMSKDRRNNQSYAGGCFYCGRYGHAAADCRTSLRNGGRSDNGFRNNSGRQQFSSANFIANQPNERVTQDPHPNQQPSQQMTGYQPVQQRNNLSLGVTPCAHCSQTHHSTAMCPLRNGQTRRQINSIEELAILTKVLPAGRVPILPMTCLGQKMFVLLDSGSSVTTVSHAWVDKMNVPINTADQKLVRAASGDVIQTVGSVTFPLKTLGTQIWVHCDVFSQVAGDYDLILGWNAFCDFVQKKKDENQPQQRVDEESAVQVFTQESWGFKKPQDFSFAVVDLFQLAENPENVDDSDWK